MLHQLLENLHLNLRVQAKALIYCLLRVLVRINTRKRPSVYLCVYAGVLILVGSGTPMVRLSGRSAHDAKVKPVRMRGAMT